MIAALESNSAYDKSKEGQKARNDRIQQIKEDAEDHLRQIFEPEKHDIDWDQPFFAASKRGTDLLKWEYESSILRQQELERAGLT